MSSQSTIENNQYSRLCRLLLDFGTQVLHNVLETHLSKKYNYCPSIRKGKCLPSKICQYFANTGYLGNHLSFGEVLMLPQVKASLQNLKVLVSDQRQILHSPTVSVENLDITLTLILIRNVCGLAAPSSNVWNKPAVSDTSVEAHCARIRELRNKVYGHRTSASVSKQDFDKYWAEITSELIPLSNIYTKADYDALRSVVMDVLVQEKYNRLLDSCHRQNTAIVEVKEKLDNLTTGKDFRNFKRDVLSEIKQNEQMLTKKFRRVEQKVDNAMVVPANYKKSSSDASTETIDENILLHTVAEKLKSHYTRNSAITPVLWNQQFQMALDKTYTTLTILHKEMEVSVDKIFDPQYSLASPSPNRILIEGNAGSGKTTLCKKLVYNWAKGIKASDNPYGLQNFKMVFLLQARHLTGSILEDIFQQQLLPIDLSMSKEDVWLLITSHEQNVLFILDGFDELTGSNKQVSDLLQGKILSDASVITTSRRGHIKAFDRFHTFLSNEGFNINQAREFIHKYMSTKDIVEEAQLRYINELVSKNRHVQELSKTPLALIFIIILVEDNFKYQGDTLTFSNIGKLCHELVSIVIRRYCRTAGIEYTKKYSETLSCKLGEIALQGFRENKSIYKSEDILVTDPNIFKCGFLVCDQSDSILDPEDIFFFVHRSIQEYFAAFNICNNYQSYPDFSFLISPQWKEVLTCLVHLSFVFGNLHLVKQIIFDSPPSSIVEKCKWKNTSFGLADCHNPYFFMMVVNPNCENSCSTDSANAQTCYEMSGALKLCHRLCPYKFHKEMMNLIIDKIPDQFAISLRKDLHQEDEVKKYYSLLHQCGKIKIICLLILRNLQDFSSEEIGYLLTTIESKRYKLECISIQLSCAGDEEIRCENLIREIAFCQKVKLRVFLDNEKHVQWLCDNYFKRIRKGDILNLWISDSSALTSYPESTENHHFVICIIPTEMIGRVFQAIRHIETKGISIQCSSEHTLSIRTAAEHCGPVQWFREYRSPQFPFSDFIPPSKYV